MALPGEPILPPPTSPDFALCSPVYAEGLSTLDCLLAANNGIPSGTASVVWRTNVLTTTPYHYRLPFVVAHGDYFIRVQSVGAYIPLSTTPDIWAAPDDIRSLAAKVIQRCVTLSGGVGGFGTLGISGLTAFAARGFTPYDIEEISNNTHRQDTTLPFLTVTLSKRGAPRPKNPGSTDPAVPLALASAARHALGKKNSWAAKAEEMKRGSKLAWYSKQRSLTSEMSYECDGALGAPSPYDCTQILLTKFGGSSSSFSSDGVPASSSDTLTLTRGTTTFLHSNTCYLAISAAATASLVLTWAQIVAAVSTLLDVCVGGTSSATSQGGRAFYSAPQQIVGRKKKKKKKRKRQSDDDGDNGDDLLTARENTNLTGLNALPPSVNMTVFEQREAWVDGGAEMKSCTWRAVERGGNVSSCVK